MTNTLLLVDIQRDYFPGGAHPLVEPEAAAEAAHAVLEAWRGSGRPIIHMQHVWEGPDAVFMRPGTDGVQIHPLVAPEAGEQVLTKDRPNSFLNTPLLERLREAGTSELTVVGMMSNLCVDATVRAGSDLGFDVTVVHDACAASDLHFQGQLVAGATVHSAFMAALHGNYAAVLSAADVLRGV